MKAVILFGHGSRDPAWRQPMNAVAARLRARGVVACCAFLELDSPDLPTAAAQLVREGATELVVLPMFLGAGRHAREDLPRLAEEVREAHPGLGLRLLPAVGEDPGVLDLIAELATR